MYHKRQLRLRWVILSLVAVVLTVPGLVVSAAAWPAADTPALQSSTTVTKSCPLGGIGDRLGRGFYVENFGGNRLDSVTLEYSARSAGTYVIEMTARAGDYGGPVIGTATINFSYSGSGDTMQTFNFGGATVNNSTITFEQKLLSSPTSLIFYDSGSGSCPDFTQTVGTTPPLDTFRKGTVGVTIRGRAVDGTDVPGCRTQLELPDHTVGGSFVANATLYWMPGSPISPQMTIPAGNSAQVLGVDKSGEYYKIVWACQKLWVPVDTMGPNYDSVWNGQPLPNVVVEES